MKHFEIFTKKIETFFCILSKKLKHFLRWKKNNLNKHYFRRIECNTCSILYIKRNTFPCCQKIETIFASCQKNETILAFVRTKKHLQNVAEECEPLLTYYKVNWNTFPIFSKKLKQFLHFVKKLFLHFVEKNWNTKHFNKKIKNTFRNL